ncbi:MAG: flagellar protein FlgN [Halomonas sp.]|uniref:flagellar protein FlgN n=1 Tax=Halomonas sp. TaxID=1486246 RepID=UPI0019EA80A7|nr:flagellar protein FlgN [Halomonas sp.]MBE0490270.1 flagellar protein FlgN [Halomonas sp.]
MSLARLLSDQQSRLIRLTQLLEHELGLLTASQVDGKALTEVARRKQELLADLERMETLRRQVQVRLGYAAGPAGARAAAEEAGCQAEWEACLSATERTARLNDLVGELLQMRASHNQKMLDFIHQIADKTLYEPTGRTGRQPGRLSTSA